MQHSFGPKIVPCLTMSFTKIFFFIPFGVLISIFASLFISYIIFISLSLIPAFQSSTNHVQHLLITCALIALRKY